MPTLFARIREALPDAVFYPPATEQEITRVESSLGHRLPEWLRDLYRCTNGIHSSGWNDPILLSLEENEHFSHSLKSWNQSARFDWNQATKDDDNVNPAVDDGWGPNHILIIGYTNGTNWATDLTESMQIIHYEFSSPSTDCVVAQDLAQCYLEHRLQIEEIHRQLYCGRAAHRRTLELPPPQKDVEFVLDMLNESEKGTISWSAKMRNAASPRWSLWRGISQQPQDKGLLFIFQRGSCDIQVATRDGDLPFVIRGKAPFLDHPLRCLVRDIPETLLCFLYLPDRQYYGEHKSSAERDELNRFSKTIWKYRNVPQDAELDAIADTLFLRDDHRLEDNAPLGG
jgi:cell wall assembly regulator SMI1